MLACREEVIHVKDFSSFDTPATKKRIATDVLIKRGGFHVYAPNDDKMEKEVSSEVDVVMSALRRYHEWANS